MTDEGGYLVGSRQVHHYVAQMNLGRFSVEPDRENPPLWTLESGSGRIRKSSVRNEAAITDYQAADSPRRGSSSKMPAPSTPPFPPVPWTGSFRRVIPALYLHDRKGEFAESGCQTGHVAFGHARLRPLQRRCSPARRRTAVTVPAI